MCGMHVHVEIADEDEGVRVIDGIRPWLPLADRDQRELAVLARGATPATPAGVQQVWGRWSSAGPARGLR